MHNRRSAQNRWQRVGRRTCAICWIPKSVRPRINGSCTRSRCSVWRAPATRSRDCAALKMPRLRRIRAAASRRVTSHDFSTEWRRIPICINGIGHFVRIAIRSPHRRDSRSTRREQFCETHSLLRRSVCSPTFKAARSDRRTHRPRTRRASQARRIFQRIPRLRQRLLHA